MELDREKMKKIFGKIENRRDEKENEKAHSSYIGKKFNVGRHTVIIEVFFSFPSNVIQLSGDSF